MIRLRALPAALAAADYVTERNAAEQRPHDLRKRCGFVILGAIT